MPPPDGPSLLGVLLKELFRGKNWQHRLDQHQLFLVWEDIVGAELAVCTRPECIRGEVLWLGVIDSVWMQQLQFQKMMLLEAINRRLGWQCLQDIRFRLDMNLARRMPAEPTADSRSADRRVSSLEIANFEETIRPLPDEELKATMRSLWRKSRKIQGS